MARSGKPRGELARTGIKVDASPPVDEATCRVAFSHTPPGAYANYVILPVAALMLILGFTTWRRP